MKPEEKSVLAEHLTIVAQFYKQDFPKFICDIYCKALEKYTMEEIDEAIGLHMSDEKAGKYMPKPCEIIEKINSKNLPAASHAMLAWSSVRREISRVGTYEKPVFDDEITTDVVNDLGGWTAMCMILEKDYPRIARDFEDRHAKYSKIRQVHSIGLTEPPTHKILGG